jgi:hypothetical protein
LANAIPKTSKVAITAMYPSSQQFSPYVSTSNKISVLSSLRTGALYLLPTKFHPFRANFTAGCFSAV